MFSKLVLQESVIVWRSQLCVVHTLTRGAKNTAGQNGYSINIGGTLKRAERKPQGAEMVQLKYVVFGS